ncbi:MAG: LamG domain-containing protein [Bacteroidota bacterium]
MDFGSDLNQNYWIHTTPNTQGKGVVVDIGNGSAAQEMAFEFDAKPDDWHQVTMVYGGGVLLLYVDGQFKKSMAATISHEPARFTIGSRRDQTKFYKGSVDDIRVFNRLLSQTDILLTKDITVPSDYEGLVAYWKLDEGLGTKAFDLSKNGMDALLLDTGTAFADKGPTFTSNTPAILNAGITNNGGYYTIEGINYSAEQSFTATPSKIFYKNYALEFNAAYAAYAPLTAFDISDTATVEISGLLTLIFCCRFSIEVLRKSVGKCT